MVVIKVSPFCLIIYMPFKEFALIFDDSLPSPQNFGHFKIEILFWILSSLICFKSSSPDNTATVPACACPASQFPYSNALWTVFGTYKFVPHQSPQG